MKLLQKYILSEFIKLLVMAVAAFIVLFIMVDLFENVDNLMKYKVPPLASIVFFIYKVPFIVSQVSPVAVLVASLLSLGLLSKHGEVTAIKAGGVRLLHVVAPILFAGFVISIGVILMNEYVTPAALKKAESFRKEWFGVQGGSFGREGMWIRTTEGIYNIRQVDLKDTSLNGITFYSIEKPFNVRMRLHSRLALWKDGAWVAEDASVWTFARGKDTESSERGSLPLEGLPGPEDLANVENLQKNMNFGELKHYIKGIEAEGYDSVKYRIDLYGKLTFPLVNFIMVLVGIPFALKTGRHSGIAAGVGLSVAIAFSYWLTFAVTRSLGQNAMIPPFLAAVFPDLLFFAIGALMFGYVRE